MIYTVICNYNALEDFKNCIKSINKDFLADCVFFVYDNNSTDGSREYLIEELDYKTPYPDFWCNDINIGKAKAINWLVNTRIPEYLENNKVDPNIRDNDLIFSLDSDISLVSKNFYQKVISLWRLLEDKVSCIVCYQTGNSLFKRNFEWTHNTEKEDFNYFIPPEGYGHGIAGGAIIVPYKYWKKVGGYEENRGIYGSNDGNLMLNLWNKTKKPICVIKELSVYHPPEDNKEYQEWKDKAHQQQLQHNKCIEDKGFFD